MMFEPKIEKESGVAPALIVGIAAAVLLIGGGLAWYLLRQAPERTEIAKNIMATDEVVNNDALKFDLPDMDVTGPNLSSMDFGSMEFGAPAPSGDGLFGNFSVDSDFSLSANIAVTAPSVSFEVPVQVPAKSAPPGGTTNDSGTPPDSGTQGGPTVSASECAQFSSIPSATYCSSVGDPNGVKLCQDCKTAGY